MLNTLIGIILCIISIILLIHSYHKNKDIIELNKWPILKNSGHITISYIEDRKAINNTNDLLYYVKFRPVIEYKYVINNRIFKNNSIIYPETPWFLNEQSACDYIQELRDMDKLKGGVDIIYNPQNFNESYLYYTKQNTTGYIISFIFFIVGLILL